MRDVIKTAKTGFVAGWGKQNGSTEPSDILHKTCAHLISQEKCHAKSSHDDILASMICAGGATEGDSGGGLIFFGTVSRKWLLGGVVCKKLLLKYSYREEKIVIYMRITEAVIDWIDPYLGI